MKKNQGGGVSETYCSNRWAGVKESENRSLTKSYQTQVSDSVYMTFASSVLVLVDSAEQTSS